MSAPWPATCTSTAASLPAVYQEHGLPAAMGVHAAGCLPAACKGASQHRAASKPHSGADAGRGKRALHAAWCMGVVPAITKEHSSAAHDVFMKPLVCLKGHCDVGQGSQCQHSDLSRVGLHLLGDEGSCRGVDVQGLHGDSTSADPQVWPRRTAGKPGCGALWPVGAQWAAWHKTQSNSTLEVHRFIPCRRRPCPHHQMG